MELGDTHGRDSRGLDCPFIRWGPERSWIKGSNAQVAPCVHLPVMTLRTIPWFLNCSRAPGLPWIPHAFDCLLLHDQLTPPHILSVWSSRDGLRGIAIRCVPHIFLILLLLFRDTFHGCISFLWLLLCSVCVIVAFLLLLLFTVSLIVAFCWYCYCLEFVLLLHLVVIVMVWCWFCYVASFVVGCFWYLFLYYCMFVVCFVYYLLLVLLVLFARDVRPGWMPPPRWGVYGVPMSDAWVVFLPRGSPYTRSSELFSSQAHGYLFLWSFAFFLLLLIML